MAVDPTPWFVSTPGAEHSAEVARVLAYAATKGDRGVVAGGSLRVKAQDVPTTSVRVLHGVAVTPSPYPGHIGQSYIMRNISSTTRPIRATGSSGGRSDAVVIRVDDAGLVGQQPEDPTAYEYARIEVVENVPASTRYSVDLDSRLDYPFVLLARIDLPPNTATITDSMIVSTIDVANRREETVVRTWAGDSNRLALLQSTTPFPVGQEFPGTRGDLTSWSTVRVPQWATHVEVRGEWLSVYSLANGGSGSFWLTFGLAQGATENRTQAFTYNTTDTSTRQTMTVVDTIPIPETMRGRNVIWAFRANKSASSAAGVFQMDQHGGLSLGLRFLESSD